MNGQCIAQTRGADDKWHSGKVEKANGRPPSVYNLFAAVPADLSKTHDGIIIHVDAGHAYQQVGKSLVKHALADFDEVPDIGVAKSIAYAERKALISPLRRGGRS